MQPNNPLSIFQMVRDQMDRTRQPLQQRGTVLPVGDYEDGRAGLAWPGLLAAPAEGMANFGRYGYGDEAVADNAKSAFDVAGGAVTGGFGANIAGGFADNAVGVFGGKIGAQRLAEKGTTGPLEAIALAERLKAEGRTPLEIYQQTSALLNGSPYAGVHYGVDGKPRFEISDATSELVGPSGNLTDVGGLTLDFGDATSNGSWFRPGPSWKVSQSGVDGPFVTHDELSQAYPELADRSFNMLASDRVKRRGGGVTGSGDVHVEAPLRYSRTGDKDGVPDTEWMRSAMAHEMDHVLADIEGFSPGGNPAAMKAHPSFKRGPYDFVPPEHTLYERLAGETQARNTQTRINMTPQERRDTPPWATQDYEFWQQIEPPTAVQSVLNRYLPSALKIGRGAVEDQQQRLYADRNLTPPSGSYPKQPVRLPSDERMPSSPPPPWATNGDVFYHPNFPNIQIGGQGSYPKSAVLIDGRPASIDDFKSEWMRDGGLEDMAYSHNSASTGGTTAKDYLAWHARRVRSGNSNLASDGDYQLAMSELADLVKNNRLEIVSIDDLMRGQWQPQASGRNLLERPTYLNANAPTGSSVPLAVQAAEQSAPKGIRAYHGSPHDFDRFSLDRIGTGEGAQAYGHGLYFAEAEDVARGYRETLSMGNSPDNYAAMDQAKEALEFAKGDKQAALKRIDDIFADSPRDRKHAELSKKYVMEPPGRMYEVNIRANPEDFLDWDKPLSQQSETVRKAVLPLAEAQAQRYAQEDAYAAAKAQAMGMNLSPAPRQPVDLSAMHGSEIAKMTGLREAGIPGIRYLDGMSRRAGEGSSNYVVFDDSLIDILRKYANAPTGAALPLAMEGQEQEPGIMEYLRRVYGIQ